ncbi:hypothetical protein B6U96_14980 [Archaeoglobales archaeon ex4484_92]|nr:MAG: hypothetical protein B6U96_14980 [Archaeoglobales archaeon ex4484_92]
MFWESLLQVLEGSVNDYDQIREFLKLHRFYDCLELLLRNNKVEVRDNLFFYLLIGLVARFCGCYSLCRRFVDEILLNSDFVACNRYLLLKYIPWFGLEKYTRFLHIVRSHFPNEVIWDILVANTLVRRLEVRRAFIIFSKYYKKFRHFVMDKTDNDDFLIDAAICYLITAILLEKTGIIRMIINDLEGLCASLDENLFLELVSLLDKNVLFSPFVRRTASYIIKYQRHPLLRRFNEIDGWLDLVEGTLLYSIARHLSYNNILEIGSFKGRSTAFIAQGIRDSSNAFRYVFSVDPHYGIENIYPFSTRREFLSNMRMFGLLENVKCFSTRSDQFLMEYEDILKTIDFAFLDGDHSYKQVKLEFDIINKYFTPRNIVVFHDVHMRGPYLVLKNAVTKEMFSDIIVVNVAAMIRKQNTCVGCALDYAYLLMLDNEFKRTTPLTSEIFGIS